ncbi:MAG: glycine--tRNA ligase [Bacteroidetes bacterium]|nr:glycine--tRNA ligase [Bacteroidota bacterium]MBU1117277.1 glycine--tRNA ligase [Bacteroidota bacterium]MBU1797383.1 glycine--tRNA ligase [Bacteroidota bacterium]
MAQNEKNVVEKIVSLAKRKGFVFQSSEIYGGLNGCWDYGPLGVELLRNIKEEWWKAMTYREDVEGLDAAILMHPKVWEASGHVENFTDPMIDCKQCKSRFRVDTLGDSIAEKKKKKILEDFELNLSEENKVLLENITQIHPEIDAKFEAILEKKELAFQLLKEANCPNCGTKGEFTEPRNFNLMFKTFVGPIESEDNVVFLRPETAQGIFVNFQNVQNSSRQKLPFGIAQIGKAFRNEINTKNFLFRTREFEQMEMQYFVNPSNDKEHYDAWKERRINWYKNLGMDTESLRFHDHPKDKLAHYAKEATDVEYKFPFGWGEIEGIHNRTDFDLTRHQQFSGKSQQYFDDELKEKFIPYIIETSAGASRSFMAFLVNAYHEEEVNGELRVVLKFHPKLAPIKAAIFPLVNKDGMPEIAKEIEAELSQFIKVFYDSKGAVGRRYRRQDENGTPFCITVDNQTIEDKTVTVRERDSMEQVRVSTDSLLVYLLNKLK